MRRSLRLLLAAALGLGGCARPMTLLDPGDPAGPTLGRPEGLRRPTAVTTHNAQDYLGAASSDGTRLLFVSDRSGQDDLWLRPLDQGPSATAIRITRHSAEDRDPAWSPDGDTIAFTSHREDPDGDLYTIELLPIPGMVRVLGERNAWKRGSRLRRLTGGATADRQPAWHPDGDLLVFTSRRKGQAIENLWTLEPGADPTPLTTGGGHDPAWSPDGRWVVFSAARDRDRADLDLRAIRPSDGREIPLTAGPDLDLTPAFSEDGRTIAFARYDVDTNRDGALTHEDRPSIARIDLPDGGLDVLAAAGEQAELPVPMPLTGSDTYDAFPRFLGDRIVYTSDQGAGPDRGLDLLALPADGMVESAGSLEGQIELARRIGAMSVVPPELRILAYRRVVEGSGHEVPVAIEEETRERIGSYLLEIGDRPRARAVLEDLVARAEETSPYRIRAEIELAAIDRIEAGAEFRSAAERHLLEERLVDGLGRLDAIGARIPGEDAGLTARLGIERGRHQIDLRRRTEALRSLETAEGTATDEALAAEAALLRGEVYSVTADARGLIRSDLALLDRYPGVAPQSTRAADRIIETVLGDTDAASEAQRLARLREIVEDHAGVPALPARALLRIGAIHAERGEPERAESTYRRVLDDFADDGAEVAEARFRLARLYYESGRWEAALDEYRALQEELPEAERAFALARESYIRRAIEKGQSELAGRDPQSAAATFVGLVKYEPSAVEAHRGLIDAYVATGRTDEIVGHYERELDRSPTSAVSAYGLGYARTFRDPPDLDGGEDALRRAVALDARIAFAHQTLGWILEQRAGRAGGIDTTRGRDLLGEALDEYQTAFALVDVDRSPGQRADLALNIGNVYLALENHRKAYEFYRRREASGRPFRIPAQEAQFHLNLAKAADPLGRYDEAVEHYRLALAAFGELGSEDSTYEIHDRLGFAHQVAGRHSEAIDSYRSALDLSRRQDNLDNALRALRNLAVNLTFEGEAQRSDLASERLEEALSLHREGLRRLEEQGGSTRARGAGSSGVQVTSVTVALDPEASRHARGFDERAEQSLMLSFIARIHREAGNAREAIEALERKRALLPDLPEAGPSRTAPAIENAILLNQLGALYLELGDHPAAFDRLSWSLGLCLEAEQAYCSTLDLSLLADTVERGIDSLDPTAVEGLVEIGAAAIELAGTASDAEVGRARCHNALARIELALARREAPTAAATGAPVTAVAAVELEDLVRGELDRLHGSLDRIRSARDHLRAGLEALGEPREGEGPGARRTRAVLALNLARLGSTERGDRAAAVGALGRALDGLEELVDADLRWRLLATRGALGDGVADATTGAEEGAADLEAAARALASIPPGLAATPDTDEVHDLFARLARRALEDEDPDAALALLERVPSRLLATSLGLDGLRGGDDPDAADAYRTAVEDIRLARAGADPAAGPPDLPALRADLARTLEPALAGVRLAPFFRPDEPDPVEAQVRLGEGEVIGIPVELPGHPTLTVFRVDAEQLAVLELPRSDLPGGEALARRIVEELGGEDARALYLSPRGALADLDWEAAAPPEVPLARVVSLDHLAASLDRRNVLREGRLYVGSLEEDADDGARTVLDEPLADRERLRAELPLHAIVELGIPLVAEGRDPLLARPALGSDGSRVRRFTLADALDVAARHRLLSTPAIRGEPAVRDAVIRLLAEAGFPSVLEAPAAVRSGVLEYLGDASIGQSLGVLREEEPDLGSVLWGAVGLDADQAIAFAEEHYRSVLAAAAGAFEEERWADASEAFAEALSLEEILTRPRDRQTILFHLTESLAREQRFAAAARYQQLAVELADRAGDAALYAEALHYLGVFRSRAEDYDGAIAALGESADLWLGEGEDGRASRAWAVRGIAEESAGRYDEALAAFREALELERALGSPEGEGKQLRRIGRIRLVRQNRYGEAEDAFRKARAIFEEAGDETGWIEATLEIGLAREAIGDLDGAIDHYLEARDLAEAVDEATYVALVGRAAIYEAQARWLGGSYPEAFTLLREALEIGRDLEDDRLRYLARNLDSLVWWSLNDHDRALASTDDALGLARALEDDGEIATVHNNRGIIHRDAGRPAQALDELTRALDVDRRIGSRWGEGYDLRNLGMTYLDMERLDTARDNLERAVAVSGSIGDRVNEVKALLSLGDALLELGETDRARETFDDVAARASALGLPEVLWRARWGSGRSLEALGRTEEAATALEEAVAVVEAMRASLKIEEMRNGFVTNKLDLYEDLVLLYLGRGEVERAFDMAERSRARGFIDLLGNAKIEPSRSASRELLDGVRDLDVRLEGLRSRPATDERDAEITAVESERRDLLTRIQLEDPQLANFVSVNPLTAADVRALLAKGEGPTVLLTYFLTEDEVVLWLVRDSGVDVVRIPGPRAALEERVLGFRQRIQAIEPVEAEARALYDTLIRPAAARIPRGARIGIVPHGILHYLSFASLSDGEAWLVERHPLFYVPSASVLGHALDGPPPVRDGLRVLAIGNPDLGTRDFDLPFAEKEVRSLRWPFPEIDILTRERATKRWLLENVRAYDVLHIASHGEFDPVEPLASALKLAHDEGEDEHAGDLYAREVFGLDLAGAQMVTLSACQTGLGKVEAGDEVIGLNRAFLYAGTPSLLSSLWRVSDVSTAVMIKSFYRQFATQPKAESLRAAQLHVMDRWPHPSYWAGMVLTGDFR